MARTRTIYVNLRRLQSTGKDASLFIRLMMACNDISLANQCQARFREEQKPIKKHVQQGALMYFVRLQSGHLKEALDLIQKVKDDQQLLERAKKCSPYAQECFNRLVDCLSTGPDYQKFHDYVIKVRNKTVFHYDRPLVERALKDRASREESYRSKITMGDHIDLWRFELSDDIVDSIITRHIWKIPRTANTRVEADRILDFGSNLCVSFLDFCGEFVSSYILERAAI